MDKEGKTLKAEPMTPRFTALHPALRGSHAENKRSTQKYQRDKESKGQAPPQARVFNPERNELIDRLPPGSRSCTLEWYQSSVDDTNFAYQTLTRNNRCCLHC